MLNKWYFGTNVHGIHHAFDQIKVAVISAKKNTSLIPICLFDSNGEDEISRDRVKWIKDAGVTVIYHRASLLDELTPIFGDAMNVFSGHWLRCDIPEIETSDQFVLYTDIDVIFLQDVVGRTPEPTTIACGPEHLRGDYSYFNSGVMVINVPVLRDFRSKMIELLKRRLLTTAPYDDQGMLNELFHSNWTHLPDEWNWKPYWGSSNEALILHFHGPKPTNVRRMAAGEMDIFGNDYKVIFNRDRVGYAQALEEFEKYESDG